MTSTQWTQPVEAFVETMPSTIAGLWSLLQTAALATCQLSLLPALDDNLALTQAAVDLCEAAEELEWAHPHLPVTGTIVDVGSAPLDDVHGCRGAVTSLIKAALHTTATLLDQPGLSTPDLLTLGRVVALLGHAHLRIRGSQA